MRRWTALAFLLAACALPGYPQQPASPGLDAESLARRIDAHYNALHSLQVHFAQSYDGMGMHRIETGTLLLAKGGRFHEGRMRWTYAQPAGKLFVFDGKDAYFYTPGQSEVQRTPAKQMDDLRSPLALLLGHADLAKQLEHLTIRSEENGQSTLEGVPRGLEAQVSRLSITASPDGEITRMTVDDMDGSRNSFTFTDEEANAPAPGNAFVFTPPAGTHVVDGMAPM